MVVSAISVFRLVDNICLAFFTAIQIVHSPIYKLNSLVNSKTWLSTLEIVNLCLSDETLKAVGPFYLVYMPGEVKDPTQGVNV